MKSRDRSVENIVCLDGSPLPVLGVAKLVFSHRNVDRPNSLVNMPLMPVEALLLLELLVVAADVLIDSDFVSACGGLNMEYDRSDASLAGVILVDDG